MSRPFCGECSARGSDRRDHRCEDRLRHGDRRSVNRRHHRRADIHRLHRRHRGDSRHRRLEGRCAGDEAGSPHRKGGHPEGHLEGQPEDRPAGRPEERAHPRGPAAHLRCFRYLSFACYLPIFAWLQGHKAVGSLSSGETRLCEPELFDQVPAGNERTSGTAG
jgi:hypothetical protein